MSPDNLLSSYKSFKQSQKGDFEVSVREFPTGNLAITDFLMIHYPFLELTQISSIYGFCDFFTRLYGGRPYNPAKVVKEDQIFKLYDKGINYFIPLSNHYFDKESYEATKPFLDRHHLKGNGVVIYNDLLAKWIKEDYPKYTRIASVIKNIDSLESIEKNLLLYDRIVLPPQLNDNLSLLSKISDKDKMILFMNNACRYKCKAWVCYKEISKGIRDQGKVTEKKKDTKGCSRTKDRDSEEQYTIFNIHIYEQLGFVNFKLIPPTRKRGGQKDRLVKFKEEPESKPRKRRAEIRSVGKVLKEGDTRLPISHSESTAESKGNKNGRNRGGGGKRKQYLEIKEPPEFDKPVFIFSLPRSGSTLLFETLERSLSLWSVGDESHHIIEHFPSLSPVSRNFSTHRLTEEDANNEIGYRLKRRFSSFLRDNSGNRYADNIKSIRLLEKTPLNCLRIPFFKEVFPDMKAIFLYRDWKSNISSMLDAWRSGMFTGHFKLPGWPLEKWCFHLPLNWQSVIGETLPNIVRFQWESAIRTMLNDFKEIPGIDWYPVEYSELIHDKEKVLKGICNFCEIPFDKNLRNVASLANLPLSKYTLTTPRLDKWKKNEEDMLALSELEVLEKEVHGFFQSRLTNLTESVYNMPTVTDTSNNSTVIKRTVKKGKVKWFSAKKGYGFLEPLDKKPEDKDIFVHFSAIQGKGYRTLISDRLVEYETKMGDKGLQVSTCTPVN